MTQSNHSQAERARTDQSLKAERTRTDHELSRSQAGIEYHADAAVQRARSTADAKLEEIQTRATHALDADGAPPTARTHAEAAQAQERSTITTEREAEDRELESERNLRQLAIASLLGAERLETDRHLAHVRSHVDDALLRVLDELIRAVRFRDEFLTLASHELNTPLTPLVLSLEALDREAAKQVPTDFSLQVSRNLGAAKENVARISVLVAELLDVSRMSSTPLAPHLERVDLGAIIDEVVDRHRLRASRASCTVTVRAPSTHGHWDAMRLRQVVENLLENALTYGAGRPIQITLAVAGAQAVLTIADEGIGIAPEFLPRLFGKFERGVSSRNFGGLGLGLYVCKTAVEALGGAIRVQSTPGQGATFIVELPIAGPGDVPA